MSAVVSSPLAPSTQRPIPLQARQDLIVERIEYLGVGYRVVKEPVGLKYYRLQPEQYYVLMLLDGRRSVEQIRDELHKELPTVRMQLTDIQHLITDLHEKGLVYSQRSGQGTALLKHHREQQRKKIMTSMRSLLYIRLPGWDPETTLQKLYPVFRFMYRPWAVGLTIAIVVSSWILLGVQFDTFRSQLPEFQSFFGWPNLLYLWITLSIAKIIHEFGHGLTCKHFGGECHEMGIMLLVFSPCLYCDVSDSWVLKNKWKRIMIGGSGMYIEILLSALAVFVWWNTTAGLMHHLCLNLFFVTTITTVVWNANPLMRFDGYYMMSDYLEIPNLRPKADRLLQESFAWYCLGIESRPDPFMPETGRFWFALFAVAAGIYRWFILAAISIFLYTVLKPYGLQSIGVTLLVMSLTMVFFNLLHNIYKIISAPRIEPMSRPKFAFTIIVLFCVIVAVLAIPFPWYVKALFIIEPHDVRHVYVVSPGELTNLNVKAGQTVRKGDVLAKLSDPEKEDHYRRLQVKKKVQEIAEDTFFQLEDDAQRKLAADRIESVQKQIADYMQQIDELTILAPCDGVVVEPPRVAEPNLEESKKQLSNWYGTPLNEQNMGCLLTESTHLLSIAPDDRFQAILLVDQSDRNDLSEGQDVELKFDHLPDRTYAGKVENISGKEQQFVPQLLSNKLGGELATVSDSQGRERLQSAAYQTTVLLDQDTPLLKSGIRGRARFLVESRSLGEWIWRYLRQTFHFRL